MNSAVFQTRDDITHYPYTDIRYRLPYKGPTKKLWILLPGTHTKLKVLKQTSIQCPNCCHTDDTTQSVCYELEDNYVVFRCERIDRWVYCNRTDYGLLRVLNE